MPKTSVQISRTVTVTREETVTVELDVPQYILRNCAEFNWVDDQAQNSASTVARILREATWDVTDEIEETEYTEIDAVEE